MAGFVPQEQMPLYYSHARCFAFPSLYEGFGLPLLEAMGCRCPIVSSNASVIPEVVEDAAITVAPLDEASLAAALRRVLTDGSCGKELITRGLKRAKLFSWEGAARETMLVYEQVEEEVPSSRQSSFLSDGATSFEVASRHGLTAPALLLLVHRSAWN